MVSLFILQIRIMLRHGIFISVYPCSVFPIVSLIVSTSSFFPKENSVLLTDNYQCKQDSDSVRINNNVAIHVLI